MYKRFDCFFPENDITTTTTVTTTTAVVIIIIIKAILQHQNMTTEFDRRVVSYSFRQIYSLGMCYRLVWQWASRINGPRIQLNDVTQSPQRKRISNPDLPAQSLYYTIPVHIAIFKTGQYLDRFTDDTKEINRTYPSGKGFSYVFPPPEQKSSGHTFWRIFCIASSTSAPCASLYSHNWRHGRVLASKLFTTLFQKLHSSELQGDQFNQG